ncbi:MAG TPA: hypothetical protein PKM27_03920 [Saprospiraceae bacterium]|nr:hypothetical protein [Saprospiraceae bacterium]
MPEQININDPKIPGAYYDQDLSLKDIIVKGKGFVLLLWKGRYLILVLSLLTGTLMYLKARFQPVTFNATLTFALNEGENLGYSSISGLLGQFGLGGSGTGKVSLDKIVELSRSMRIVNAALFDKAAVGGTEDFLANHIIRIYALDKKWAEADEAYRDFRFRSDSLAGFSLLENAALKRVYGFTVGGEKSGLLSCTYKPESTIFSLSSQTENEELSLALTDRIFYHLSRFYIQQSSDKQKQTFDLVKAKADSIYERWTSSEYAISNMDESEGALWAPTDRTRKTIQSKQSNMYAIAYGEALKNLEIADYALKNSTPFIREIDRPFPPLDAQAPNRLRQLLMGLILGGVLASAWILGKNLVHEAIKS